MAKDLVSEQKLPTPVTLPSTGDAKIDAALATLLVFPHSASHPWTRPSGPDYDKVCKVAAKADSKALLKILATPGLLEAGQSTWDEDKFAKLSPAKKKEYRKATEAASEGRKIRIAFISWLVEAIIPDGYKELLAIVGDDDIDADIRLETLRYMRVNFDSKKQLLEMVKAVGLDLTGNMDKAVQKARVVQEAISCWHQADPKGAYDKLSKLLDPATVKKTYFLQDAILSSVYRGDGKFDPRWQLAIAGMMGSDLDVISSMALKEMKKLDPKVIPVITKALGPLAKKTYFYGGLLEVVASVGTMDTLPILQRAIEVDPDDKDKIIGMVPAKSKPLIAALQAISVEADEGDKRERPTLKFKKVKAYKAPKLPSLDKQEAEYRKMFADAGIAAAYDKVAQTSVLLIPTRVDEKTLALGATKLGGHPDLPDGTKWPRVNKLPLSFLAQLNFADFAKLAPDLPKSGTLAIFVDNDASAEGGDYLENAKAIFTKAGTKLVRHEVPEDFVDVIYQACKCNLVQKISLPSPSNAHATKALKGETLEKYEADVWTSEEEHPKVLGYRDYGYDGEEPVTARLLLQLPGDNQSDMEFGDADPLSFFISVKDLAKGNFAKIWPHVGD